MPRFRRQYKIQEVIKRRQVMLVQVVKKNAAPRAPHSRRISRSPAAIRADANTARGGGISRKITSGEDRTRLKEIAQELEVPEGMGVILRTAAPAAPSSKSNATSNICSACGRRCATSRSNRWRRNWSTRKAP